MLYYCTLGSPGGDNLDASDDTLEQESSIPREKTGDRHFFRARAFIAILDFYFRTQPGGCSSGPTVGGPRGRTVAAFRLVHCQGSIGRGRSAWREAPSSRR